MRAGDTVGDQMRYPIHFPAAMRSAVWLEQRRFFLAASGHARSWTWPAPRTRVSAKTGPHPPVRFPAHVLRADATSVLGASPDGTGTGIAVHRTDVVSRTSEHLVEARLGELFGFAQDPDGGPAFLLASLPSNDPTQIRPVLLRITGHRSAATPPGTRTDGVPLWRGEPDGARRAQRLRAGSSPPGPARGAGRGVPGHAQALGDGCGLQTPLGLSGTGPAAHA
ncbi:hypothetical protein ABZV61_39810 [Streptomyces sp900116325]|uniref:Uncharacterized protein n=1 Tax=Streptomyces sp. 900116325 TaxID=3154295 RepID=A0ABV2ULK7_9ACTN